MSKVWKIFIFVFLSLFIGISGRSLAAGQHPVQLRRANLMRTENTPQGAVRYLDGNVWITQDTLSITGDQAVYQEALGQLVFTGHVHFTEPTRQMWAEQATYYEKDGHASAQGNVKIEQDSLLLTCDRAAYMEQRKEVNMLGNVFIHSLKENAIMTGGHGLYNRPDGHASMEMNPRLVRYFTSPDSTRQDSMVVTGNLIEYFFDPKQARVTGNVHIQRNDFDAWGDKLNYYDEGQWAQLTGKPRMQRRFDNMKADTVNAYFKDQVLQRVHLAGKSVATSPVDTLAEQPLNVVTGKQIDLQFAKGELDSIQVEGNAISTYYVRQKEGESGANHVSGDVIDMKVDKGQITWVYVEGGTEGTYYPRRLEGLAERDGSNRPANPQPQKRTTP